MSKKEYISDLPYGTDMILCAFRYALGRMTYITQTISNALIREWPNLDEHLRKQIQKEINEAVAHDMAGMSCDVANWQKVLDLEVDIVMSFHNGEINGYKRNRSGKKST